MRMQHDLILITCRSPVNVGNHGNNEMRKYFEWKDTKTKKHMRMRE